MKATNQQMTSEQLDELMVVAVSMQRDAEKLDEQPVAVFAYAVQLALAELQQAKQRIDELTGAIEVCQHDLSDTEDAMHIWAERAEKVESDLRTRTGGLHEPVAYAPKGHLARYLKGENSGCWVYGKPTNDDDERLYFELSAPSVKLPTNSGWKIGRAHV